MKNTTSFEAFQHRLKLLLTLCLPLLGLTLSAQLSVTSLTLVNADTDTDIQTLQDGDTLDLSALPTTQLNVRANVSGSVNSVRFAYDGDNNYQTENLVPFALAGDNSGDYDVWTPSTGSHTLTATPYPQNNAGGTAGNAQTVNFTVIQTQTTSKVCGQYPGGRIALLNDGNQHDLDDIGALPMALAMIDAADINSAVVYIGHSSHIGHNDASQEQEMIQSATGAANRFGFPQDIIYNIQEYPDSATDELADRINNSTASDRLWIVSGGPMEAAWRAINKAQPSKRQYVTMVSHSQWNNNHVHTSGPPLTKKWDDIKDDFASDGVQFIKIQDQNHSDGGRDFENDIDNWKFLKNSSNPDYQWLYSRNLFSNVFDVSDAGMTWWLITGGPNGG